MTNTSPLRQQFWRHITLLLFLFALSGAQLNLAAQCCADFTLTAPAVQPDPLQCCVTISGRIPDNCLPVQWTIEQTAGGTSSASGTVTSPLDTWISETICSDRADGPFSFRLIITDMNGNELCRREDFTYDCNSHPCCSGFTFEAIGQTSSDPNECCFVLQGTKNSACSFSTTYTIQEEIAGSWSDYIVNEPLVGTGFTTPILCGSSGSRTFRLILYTGGNAYCVKEVAYSCQSCCEMIDIQISGQLPIDGQCCYNVVINTPPCLLPPQTIGTIRLSERDWRGRWHSVGPVISYYNGQQGISYQHCLQYDGMPARIRFDFHDQDGNLLCSQEKPVSCAYTSFSCCDQVTVTSNGQVPDPFNNGRCCFDFSVYLPPCMPQTMIVTREKRLTGGWYTPPQAAVLLLPGQTVSYNPYCFTYDAVPARIGFDFFDQNGNLLCSKELSVDCQYDNIGDPGGTLPPKLGAQPEMKGTDIIQNLSSTPNPVTDAATVSYTLSEAATVSVELVDILGQHITIQSATTQAGGVHMLPFTTSNLPNGMYTVVVKANGRQATISIVISR